MDLLARYLRIQITLPAPSSSVRQKRKAVSRQELLSVVQPIASFFSGLGTWHLPFPEARSCHSDQPMCPSLGKAIWTLNPNYLSNGTLAAPVVVLPDLDEDGVRDLVVLAIGELQV